MGEERLTALVQESLAVKSGAAMQQSDTRRVIVDTTVQPKNVMFPTNANLLHRAREWLVRLARQAGVTLRQSYVRVGNLALIQHQRYPHAKQFKRATKALRAIFLWPLYPCPHHFESLSDCLRLVTRSFQAKRKATRQDAADVAEARVDTRHSSKRISIFTQLRFEPPRS